MEATQTTIGHVRRPHGFKKTCEAIRDAVPIVEVAERYTSELRPIGGDKYLARCPLGTHPDRNPSFYLYPDGHYYCYGCKECGDVVDLHFHCGGFGEPREAVLDLVARYNVKVPKRPERWHRWQREKYGRSGLHHQIEEVRQNVRRRRWFRIFILPELEAIEDPEERAEEAKRAWADTQNISIGGR